MSVLNVIENISSSDQITETISLVGGVNTPVQNTLSPQYQLTNGTSAAGTVAGTIDLHWELAGVNAVTLASSASVTYTLSALTDVAGRSIALARVRKFHLYLISHADGDYLAVGNAGTHPWTGFCSSGTATLGVNDELKVVATNKVGMPVGSGSSDQVKITNAGSGSITFAIAISGCST